MIVKLGQNYRLDEMFVEHINNAIANGMDVGIYYYTKATNSEQAIRDAEWVSEQIQQYLNGQCPEMGIWYDVEDESIIDATAICKAFIDSMPCEVGIYANYDWLTNRIDTAALNVPIWCAQYDSQCDFPGAEIWQYTDSLSALS